MIILDIFMVLFLFFIGIIGGLISVMIGLKFPIKKKNLNNVCDYCDNAYDFKELIPIVSYFKNDKKCNYCKNKLNKYYPLLELVSGILFSLSYILYGFSYEMIVMIIITVLSVIIFVSDFKYYIINDSPLLVCSIIILLFKLVVFGLKTFILSFISGLALFGFLFVMRLIGNALFKTDTLGGGDIKLAFVFGITLGIRLSIVSVILGALLAFPYAIYSGMSKVKKEIPFGPFLVSGFYIVFLFMDSIKFILENIF